VQFVRDHRSDPFFLYLPFNAPHYPMHAPARYTGRFPNLAPERRKALTGDDALFLSNLAEDPAESKNLRHLHPEILDDLRTRVERWSKEVMVN
jgi:hypothetical protein